jgi:alkanesulfonate monooxygenase SsuD/methylene tetrahydromethanopterin reductase-like flavin-dependent oxidoreductase (luciferase family)
MKVGIGLPNAVTGTSGAELIEFARAAETNRFSTLGTIDRIHYGNFEPLIALAAAAAVTESIGLTTSVLLGPLRRNAVQAAKQALSVNELSGGRLTLGIGLGARDDDFEVSGVEVTNKAEQMDSFLHAVEETFENERIGPRRAGVPEILIGGSVKASFDRAARFGNGWIAGGAPPEAFAEMAAGVRAAWSEAKREGEPRLAALGYFSLGDDAKENAQAYLGDYYAFLGEETANMIASSAATSTEMVKGYVSAFESVGCDELILFPCSGDPAQARLLREAIDA